jgi:hypothetical protein
MPNDYRGPGTARHAARLVNAPDSLGHNTRRALRLFATAGIWVAGLCLVVASTALVAAASAPHVASTTGDATRVRTAQTGRAPHQQLASFHGHGNATTRSFRIAPYGPWELRWSYSCAAGGEFVVETSSATASGAGGDPSVDEAGVSGSGDTWLDPDGRSHRLVVISTCDWTIKVVQPG